MANIIAIENGKIVLERGIIWDGVIVAVDGRIVSVGKRSEVEISTGATRIDAKGAYVGPGFVDIHVHGCDDCDIHQNPKKAAAHFLRHGETTILATPSYSRSFAEHMEGIETVKREMGSIENLKGFYMEGPYTNPKYGSNADNYQWNVIDPTQYEKMIDAAGRLAKVWTIAPERMADGLLGFLKYARKINPTVVFAVGHSEAYPWDIRALGEYRPTLETHSMNAIGRPGESRGLRGYGPDEYCFKEPDVYCELISDSLGVHVHSELQRLLIHMKGTQRVVLITDSTKYDSPAPEHMKHTTDLNFDHNGGLSGSRLTMDVACRNIMHHTSCGIAKAFAMAATNPARAIGMGSELGVIEPGKKCDLVFVDDMFNVKEVMMGGKLCNLD